MGKRTGVIKYNLNKNGRTFTGQKRDIDIDAALRLFNGAFVQEAIKKGDIVGYVGHQFREKFGLDVPETVIVDGKQVALEPSNRTIYFKCYPNGDVEHEQEFLDTASGRVAQRLWESKAYGFSSAIYAPEENGLRTPKGYFGMDLVRAPNYDDNRGYAVMLDSAGAGAFGLEGGAASFLADNAALLDSVDSMIKASDEFAERISNDYLAQCKINDDLIEQNSRLLEKLRAAGIGGAMLDSAVPPPVMERGINMDRGTDMLDAAKRFMALDKLPVIVVPEEPKAEDKEQKALATVAKGVKNAMSLVSSVVRGS